MFGAVAQQQSKSLRKASAVIKSVSEFISFIENKNIDSNRTYLYRGQCDRFNLEPGIARKKYEFKNTKLETEKRILTEFKAQSMPYLKILPHNNLEYLVIAQHYGVPTRLLDWTENALAALYFAVSSLPDETMKPEV